MIGKISDFDDSDTCGCEFGKSCSYHKEISEIKSKEFREESIRQGIDPDVQIDENLFGKLLAIELDPDLTDSEKTDETRKLIPLRRKP